MSRLPTGTVTFLFADLEGSTGLVQRLGDASYADLLAEYQRLLASACGQGEAVSTEGDGSLFAFARARDAVAAAVAAQRLVAKHPWPAGASVRARIGVHTGEAEQAAGDYTGLDVYRAARICAAGHGEQILISGATAALVSGNLPEQADLRDLGSHRLKDLSQPERIFQIVHPDLRVDFPPLRAHSDKVAHNLPHQLTSFIGRGRETDEVKRRLRAVSLLTLTGSGGCGKTRLALQVAADLVGEYPDGTWLVEFASLVDPGLVVQAVASTLGLREVPGQGIMDSLLEYLRPRTLLLILDNCEHLVEACARLAEALLRNCPRLRILVTSREPLGIAGEMAWRVPSLSVPDPAHTQPPEHLLRYEAVRLFVERAAAVRPAFALAAETAPAIVAVCRRLDGIPLAIELAAARVASMTVAQIERRLDDGFRLLTQGNRTALPRQRTLETAIEWSYRLLLEPERILLRRLAVFAGGWSLEAAEEVCAGGAIETPAVLDLLAGLAFKSLVLTDERDGEVRYRLLETVRQYGMERLRESGEHAEVRRRHHGWCLRLAERAEPGLAGGPEQQTWLDRLASEYDNVVAALEWSQESGEVEAGLRLGAAVWRYWYVRGHFAEGRARLETLLQRAVAAPPALRAKAMGAAGFLAVCQTDYASGRPLLEESLKIWREVGDPKAIAMLLNQIALASHYQGDDATALAAYEESLAIRREIGDTPGIAQTLNNLGQLRFYPSGDYVAARALFAQSVAMWREVGDQRNLALTLVNLGVVAVRQGDLVVARSVMSEGLGIQARLGDRYFIALSLEAFADLAVEEGNAVRVARLLAAAETLREAIGAPLPPTGRANHERKVTAARSRLGASVFASAWAEGRALTLDEAIAEAYAGRGRTSRGRSDTG